MTLDEVIERYTSNAEYERIHGSLQGCLEFRQLVKWLKDYKRLLEQEPSGDLISRQAVLDLLEDTNNGWIINEVLQLPPVKPQETKTGYREYNDIYDHYLCGNCKTVVMDYDNFCPNCGARLVEEQEGANE